MSTERERKLVALLESREAKSKNQRNWLIGIIAILILGFFGYQYFATPNVAAEPGTQVVDSTQENQNQRTVNPNNLPYGWNDNFLVKKTGSVQGGSITYVTLEGDPSTKLYVWTGPLEGKEGLVHVKVDRTVSRKQGNPQVIVYDRYILLENGIETPYFRGQPE